MGTREHLEAMLARRLPEAARAWLEEARRGASDDPGGKRLLALLSAASRHVPRAPLAPDEAERRRAGELLEGWDPERWTLLESARVALLLARGDLATPEGAAVVEEAFRYADVGELCALYRALAHLPQPERFAWRAGEGARTNMRAVFEATCCDTPYPARHFDDVPWRQAVIKSLFVGAPTWRMWGLDGRLDEELARMALDFADERRSAGRAVPPMLWLCLGGHGGGRGLRSLERELGQGPPAGRAAAALGLARAGEAGRLAELRARDDDPLVRATIDAALGGRTGQRAFAPLEG